MKKRFIPAAVARNLNAQKRDISTLPGCAVGGMVRPGAMCGSVIVGGKLCGHTGDCQHKAPNAALMGRASAACEGPLEGTVMRKEEEC